VTADIPDNSVVVLEKPRIICKNSMDNQFYSTKKNKLVYFDNGEWVEV
jgi:hypothetical protein